MASRRGAEGAEARRSFVAIKRGYSKDVLTYRGLTIALIVGIIMGFILGHLI